MEIKEAQESKFVGIIIDNNLNWKSHFVDVINKVSKFSGLIYKIRYLLDTHCLKQIYFSPVLYNSVLCNLYLLLLLVLLLLLSLLMLLLALLLSLYLHESIFRLC